MAVPALAHMVMSDLHLGERNGMLTDLGTDDEPIAAMAALGEILHGTVAALARNIGPSLFRCAGLRTGAVA